MDENPFGASTNAVQSSAEASSSSENNGVSRGRGRGAPRARRAGGVPSRGAPSTRAKPFSNRSTVFNAPDKAGATPTFTGGPAEAAKRSAILSSSPDQGPPSSATPFSFGPSANVFQQGHSSHQDGGTESWSATEGAQESWAGTTAFGSSVFGGGERPATTMSSPAPPEPAERLTSAPKNALGGSAKDDEERKKRFENLPSQNRFFELKSSRDALRARYIREGLLPDPDKPQDLSAAQSLRGTCQDMCPDFEREEREFQNEGDALEMFPGSSRIDPALAVKIYRRPAAGRELPLPEDVRPPAVLRRTLDYLVQQLLPADPSSPQFTSVQPFMWNRTRAIRQDFIVQSERGALTIECHERIARYHILCLHWKGGIGAEGWSEQQELEQLRKTIRSLTEFYEDLRQSSGRPSPNEAEFRAYNLLLHMHDPETLREAEMLPAEVFDAPSIQAALRLRAYAQRSNNVARRGRPSNTESTLNLWTRFFEELKHSEDVSYLLACLAENTFTMVRAGAVKAMGKAYGKMGVVPVDYLRRSLGMDDDEGARAFCVALHGEEVLGEGDRLQGLKLYQASDDGSTLPKAPFSETIVEAKRRHWSCQDIIDGKASYAVPLLTQIDGTDLTRPAGPAGRRAIPVAAPRTDLPVSTLVPKHPAPLALASAPIAAQKKPDHLNTSKTVKAESLIPPQASSSVSFSSLSAKAPSFTPSIPSIKPSAATPAFGGTFGGASQSTTSSFSAFSSTPVPVATSVTETSKPKEEAPTKTHDVFSFGGKQTTIPSISFSSQQKGASASQPTFASLGNRLKSEEEVAIKKEDRPIDESAIANGPKSATFATVSPSAAQSLLPRTSSSDAKGTSLPSKATPPKIEERPRTPPKITAVLEPKPDLPKRTVESVVAALSKMVMDDFLHHKVLVLSEQACRREERKRRQEERDKFVKYEVETLTGDLEAECVEDVLWQVTSESLAEEMRRRRTQQTTVEKWLAALDAARLRKAQERRLLEVRAELKRRRIDSSPRSGPASVNGNKTASLRRSLADSRAGLSLKLNVPTLADTEDRDVDEELKIALLSAEKARQELWKPNTFRDSIIGRLIKVARANRWGAGPMYWTVALATASDKKTLDWLRGKLGLHDGASTGETTIPLADRTLSLAIVDTQKLGPQAWNAQRSLGLVIFEIDPKLARAPSSPTKEVEECWNIQRHRLSELSSSDYVRKSIFSPRLLVLSWSYTSSKEKERTRKAIFARLGLSATEQERAAWSGGVAFAELGNADNSPPDLCFDASMGELFAFGSGVPTLLRTGGRKKVELQELVVKVRTPWSTFVKILQDVILERLRTGESKVAEACEIASKALTMAVNLGNIALQGLINVSDFAVDKRVVALSTIALPPLSRDQTTGSVDEHLRAEAVAQVDEMIRAQVQDEEEDEDEDLSSLQHDLSSLELIRSLAWSQNEGSDHSGGNAGGNFAFEKHLERLFSYVVARLEEAWIGIDESKLVGRGEAEEGKTGLELVINTAQEVERLGQRALLDLDHEVSRWVQEGAAELRSRANSKKRAGESILPPSPPVQQESEVATSFSSPSKRKKVGDATSTLQSPPAPLSRTTSTSTPRGVKSLLALIDDAKKLLSSSSP
ncbi:hypothetical protein FA10DRAFT_269500 [Acaromyces ingoldii]|uniref:SAC3/GANP/THP3 conserved domain-containing protein n=1 Tax=Acaromyces ingoldii TaxID=215250 RepID=A0A316YDF9_9BASI|nr:hypothetical protein FA10DRAFT_269500 [Acaromyces ingoldii]PWN87546.1 hypothetical protein FA10DRAFT_269500 [Acaromyces ingoldii]